jgi:hypothetical protein
MCYISEICYVGKHDLTVRSKLFFWHTKYTYKLITINNIYATLIYEIFQLFKYFRV